MNQFFISIDYNEENQKSYNGINISLNLKEIHKINTGEFDVDWVLMQRFIDGYDEKEYMILYSSNVDHFFMDGDDYIERPVDEINGEYVFVDWRENYLFSAVVKKEFSTFAEHKEHIKKKLNQN